MKKPILRSRLLSAGVIATTMASVSAAQARIPACALHLAEPAPGETLSPMQLAANQSCLTELKQEDEATERVAKIYAAESKMVVDPEKVSTGSANATAPARSLHPARPDEPASGHQEDQDESSTSLPRVAQILVDTTTASASLLLADGGSIDVLKGAALPDGTIVASILPDAVFIRRNGKTLRLPFDDGNPHPSTTRNSAVVPHFRFPVGKSTR